MIVKKTPMPKKFYDELLKEKEGAK